MHTRRTFALWLAAMPAVAHHAEPLYDLKNPTPIKGQVTRVEWENPHVYVHVIVTTEKGPEDWAIELSSPNTLKHRGWQETTLRPGDAITCTGGRSRSGARTMRAITIELPDGKRLKG